MPLVRLATLADYAACERLGRTMYQIAWCDKLCPGNPTDDAEQGLAQFNEWQCAVAAGHENVESQEDKLTLIVSWCLANQTSTSIKIASEIVGRYKQGSKISLAFEASEYDEPALAYRYELAFLNETVLKLPALQIMQLQTLMQVAI